MLISLLSAEPVPLLSVNVGTDVTEVTFFPGSFSIVGLSGLSIQRVRQVWKTRSAGLVSTVRKSREIHRA